MTDRELKAKVERLQSQVDELIKEQVDFMADYNAIIDALRDELARVQGRLHRIEQRGRDE